MTWPMAKAAAGPDHRSGRGRHADRCEVFVKTRDPIQKFFGDITMTWTTPTATDFRFGFEITMYIATR